MSHIGSNLLVVLFPVRCALNVSSVAVTECLLCCVLSTWYTIVFVSVSTSWRWRRSPTRHARHTKLYPSDNNYNYNMKLLVQAQFVGNQRIYFRCKQWMAPSCSQGGGGRTKSWSYAYNYRPSIINGSVYFRWENNGWLHPTPRGAEEGAYGYKPNRYLYARQTELRVLLSTISQTPAGQYQRPGILATIIVLSSHTLLLSRHTK